MVDESVDGGWVVSVEPVVVSVLSVLLVESPGIVVVDSFGSVVSVVTDGSGSAQCSRVVNSYSPMT